MTTTMSTTMPVDVGPGIPEDWWDRFEPPPGFRAEIIQGVLVLTPSPGVPHAFAATRVMNALQVELPEDQIVVQALEWSLPHGGMVAAAPVPDLLVISKSTKKRLVESPLMAVEIMSPSDWDRLPSGLRRVHGKRLDYAANGLQHYLEVHLVGADAPIVHRFELGEDEDGEAKLILTDSVAGDEVLRSKVPYPYELCPAKL